MADVVVVTLEKVHKSLFSLASVLFVACQTTNAIYELVAFTADLHRGHVVVSYMLLVSVMYCLV